jgi:retinol dehydrogenase-13
MEKETKQVALVTGATGVIGQAIVEGLIRMKGIEVVPSGRNPQKIQTVQNHLSAVKKMRSILPPVLLDQGDAESIRTLRESWKGPLHILIINASATPLKREQTPEGIEVQWAVNVLGYHRLIKVFSDILAYSADETPSRIVVVASSWAGGLDVTDPEFKRRKYDTGTAYRQSKQAERMLASAWAAFLKEQYGSRVTVNACHPGEVNTPLSNSLGFGGHESPAEGADTPVWLATAKELETVTGGWFTYRTRSTCRFASDVPSVQALWKVVESYK